MAKNKEKTPPQKRGKVKLPLVRVKIPSVANKALRVLDSPHSSSEETIQAGTILLLYSQMPENNWHDVEKRLRNLTV